MATLNEGRELVPGNALPITQRSEKLVSIPAASR